MQTFQILHWQPQLYTTINLPRIALNSKGDQDLFFKELDQKIDLVIEQLLERFEIQAHKKVKEFSLPDGPGSLD